jgi:hypothetical protein
MPIKKLIEGQPNFTDRSQYNFDDNETVFDYDNSTGLPPNKDKFTKKDLYTADYGDDLNNAIIARNLKFEGGSFIRVDRLRIVNSGVSYDIRGIDIRGYMFSEKRFIDVNGYSPDGADYDELTMPAGSRFFRYTPNNIAEGNDIGNLRFVEGEEIAKNLSVGDSDISAGDFQYADANYSVTGSLTVEDAGNNTITQVFDEYTPNPIYIVIWKKGDADRWWGTDKRKRKFTIFKIDNTTIFDYNEATGDAQGTIKVFDELSSRTETGDGGSGAAEAAAWSVQDLQISINTRPGGTNNWQGAPDEIGDDEADFERYFSLVQPPTPYYFGESVPRTFLNVGPDRQLFNTLGSGTGAGTEDLFPDFFPSTTVGIVDTRGELSLAYSDLQSYYDKDEFVSFKSSAPATITFDIKMCDPTDTNLASIVTGEYVYFVVDWNDVEDELKTLQDILVTRPINLFDLLQRQNEDIYIPRRQVHNSIDTTYTPNKPFTHTYNTPGIKNVKIVVFSYDSATSQVGRWKLVKCRFFLDIPKNQYFDFGELGGQDYKTLPWPFTTPIIGGMDEKSKYKISIQDTLSSGNLLDTDIIDERFLVNDFENDEMGQSVKKIDLEQVRYFNKPYGINDLLEIPLETITTDLAQPIETFYNPTSTLEENENTNIDPEYLASLPFPQYVEEFDLSGNNVVDFEDAGEWTQVVTPPAGRPDISDMLIYLGSGLEPPSSYTYPDYVYEWSSFSSIPFGNTTYQVFNPYNDFEYWNGSSAERTFSKESSVGQIFINDNLDLNLKESCKLELNTGNITGKSIYDSSGNTNKGLIIGDYKVKKQSRNEAMRRDTFIKIPKKADKSRGAL